MRIFLLAFLISNYLVLSAQDKIQKLIVAEFMKGNGAFNYVTSYNFKNGIFIGKDTIIQIGDRKDGFKTPKVGFSNYRGIIYKNRYYIPSYGSVIDLKQASIIKTVDGDDFIEIHKNSDTVIFYRNNAYTGKGFLMLNLSTLSYDFIAEETWYEARKGRSNPNNTHYLEVDRTTLPYKIWLNDSSENRKLIIPDVKSGPAMYSDAQIPNIETYWIDNRTFLYVIHHRLLDSLKKNMYHKVEMRKYDIETDLDQEFYTHDSLTKGILNGYFVVDPTNRLLHKASSNDYYLVDLENKKLTVTNRFNINTNFEFTSKTPRNDYERTFYFKGKEIGNKWSANAKATENTIAINYGDHGSNLGYPKGIQIWTEQTKEWLTIDIPWINAILGWIEE